MSTDSQLQDQIARLQDAIQRKRTGTPIQVEPPRNTRGSVRGARGGLRGRFRGTSTGKGVPALSFHPYPKAWTLDKGNSVNAHQPTVGTLNQVKPKRYEELKFQSRGGTQNLTRKEEPCSQFTRTGRFIAENEGRYMAFNVY
jgi:hypothetical protein